jgi:hypothetical protein
VRNAVYFCTPFSFLDSADLTQKMRGRAQKLHLAQSNTAGAANPTDERIDVTNRDLRNFPESIEVATLCG